MKTFRKIRDSAGSESSAPAKVIDEALKTNSRGNRWKPAPICRLPLQ
ncbi:hypothetical protein OOK41_10970 [Micromonospora sp. NBC_01655]|nr:hypothetical protein [Micromonospora sp. NBC_01655]MCX4470822.1 hypothetical protein [Micromonospora sp. NBC_01655]